MLPKQRELEEPILRVLADHGGQARPDKVYAEVRKCFPQLSDADLIEVVPSGENRFENRIRFARLALVDRGEMHSPSYGIWGITQKGMMRIQVGNAPLPDAVAAVPAPLMSSQTSAIPVQATTVTDSASTIERSEALSSNLEELFEDYLESFERKVIQALFDLTPSRFEQFAAQLLIKFGFRNMKVTNTNTAPDGGIDGSGELKIGLASVRAAFQCKKWKTEYVVSRPEIDKFRGAIQGQYEHGYFFTTSRFSTEARQASVKDGAVPIFLFDGHEIVQIMIEKGLGIVRRPIEAYEDHIDSLFEEK